MQALELAMTAPQVMSIRLMNMALAGASPSARDHREFHLMGAEKLVTFYESWNAMWLELFPRQFEVGVYPLFSSGVFRSPAASEPGHPRCGSRADSPARHRQRPAAASAIVSMNALNVSVQPDLVPRWADAVR
jgi:hypothetical protein